MTIHTILLTLHIITFSFSLLLFPVLALIAFAMIRFYRVISIASIVSTGIGFTSGVMLLVTHPVGAKCLTLAAYLIVFGFLYYAARRTAINNPIHSQI